MKQNYKYVGFLLPEEDLEEFDRLVTNDRTSRAALLRKCIIDRIKEAKAC